MMNSSTPSDQVQEYSLLDLIVVLHKYRKLFIYTVVIVTILGCVLTLLSHMKKQYVYRQPVQLASYYLNGKQYALEGSVQIINAVNNLYLPRFIAQYKTQYPLFNEGRFIENFSAKTSFAQTQDQTEVPSNTIYFEYRGFAQDLEIFQLAIASLLQQITQQEQPFINSLLNSSKSNLMLMQTEVPKLERVGDLLKSYSSNPNSDAHQELAMTVTTRETYLDLISQSQTVQNIIQFKQTINELNQKIDSMTSTSLAPLIILNAKPKISLAVGIVLSFIAGLFIGLLLVFIRAISASINAQLKLRKN